MKKITSFIMMACIFIQVGGHSYANLKVDYDYINSFVDMINKNYEGYYDNESLNSNIVKNMFNYMDDYSKFYTNEELQYLMDSLNGTYKGLGIVMESINDKIIIVDVIKNSPAEKNGLKYGDEILKVNGTDTFKKSAYDVTKEIKESEGDIVNLVIKRENVKSDLNHSITMESIEVNPVNYKIIGNIGYIKLDLFSSNSADNILKVINYFRKKEINKLILDLRNNPGGELDQAIKIGELLLPKSKLIAKVNYYNVDEQDESFYSENESKDFEKVILVNGMSASASEIVASSIKDNQAGVLVGDKTFGKAKVQKIFPVLNSNSQKKYFDAMNYRVVNAFDLPEDVISKLKDEDLLGWVKLTIGQYETLKNSKIDENGITPDYLVENKEFEYDYGLIEKLRKNVKPKLNQMSVDVYNCEKLLKVLGYSVDQPDLILDKKTFNSIKQFQRDNGLYGYGVLDFSTQEIFNKKLDNILVNYDNQLMKAIELLKK
ncbi:MAG: S41 family peptidase [Clostridiales bacterium]